jgi:hypothetical protein
MRFAPVLLLVACSGDGGSATDDTADPPLPTVTSQTAGPESIGAGCLDTPCVHRAVGRAAYDLCVATAPDPSDAKLYWGENRYLSGQGASGTSLTCASASLTDADCPAMCDAAGLGNPYYNSASKDCSCLGSLPEAGDLAERLIDTVCPNRTADATIGAANLTAGVDELTYTLTVTCRDGNSLGTDACEQMMNLANAELGSGFVEFVDFGAGCGLGGT